MNQEPEYIENIFSQFQVPGEFTQAVAHGSGHIHNTYLVTWKEKKKQKKIIMQRINSYIFPCPNSLMTNISLVTDFLRKKLRLRGVNNLERRVLSIIPTHSGQLFLRGEDDGYWRCYRYIENASTYDVLETSEQAYEIARAFGQFQALLQDFPSEKLATIIKNFHDPLARLDKLRQVVEEDPCHRLSPCKKEVEILLSYAHLAQKIESLIQGGSIPLRIVHNDTKINNAMLDNQSGKGVCVVDLDLVMPGYTLYDFGDLVRTGTGEFSESEQDLSNIKINEDRFTAVTRGYLEEMGEYLSTPELENLVFASQLICYELAIRFLTDYLEGDPYFKTKGPEHNLERTRTQIQMIQTIERQQEALEKIVQTYV